MFPLRQHQVFRDGVDGLILRHQRLDDVFHVVFELRPGVDIEFVVTVVDVVAELVLAVAVFHIVFVDDIDNNFGKDVVEIVTRLVDTELTDDIDSAHAVFLIIVEISDIKCTCTHIVNHHMTVDVRVSHHRHVVAAHEVTVGHGVRLAHRHNVVVAQRRQTLFCELLQLLDMRHREGVRICHHYLLDRVAIREASQIEVKHLGVGHLIHFLHQRGVAVVPRHILIAHHRLKTRQQVVVFEHRARREHDFRLVEVLKLVDDLLTVDVVVAHHYLRVDEDFLAVHLAIFLHHPVFIQPPQAFPLDVFKVLDAVASVAFIVDAGTIKSNHSRGSEIDAEPLGTRHQLNRYRNPAAEMRVFIVLRVGVACLIDEIVECHI